MPTLTNLNIDPYFDDFDEAKQFVKVLFRPGFAVQTRELNQLQTVLQTQIERFGTHIFKNGAMVVPGKSTLDLEYSYITIEPFYIVPSTDGNTLQGDEIVDPKSLIGAVLTNETLDPANKIGLEAVVVNVVDRDRTDLQTGDPITLYIQYREPSVEKIEDDDDLPETTEEIENSESNDDVVERYSADNDLFIRSYADVQNDPTLSTTSSRSHLRILKSGYGSALHMQEGVYYVNGFFHKVYDSVIILDKYSASPTYSIGFQVVEELVTPEEDSSLVDNALGTSNFKGPGAHRLKLNLELVKKKLTIEDESDFTLDPEELPAIDYVEIMKVRDGLIEEQVRTTQYNILEDTLSRRIYDQSGNFVVDPFSATIIEHLDEENDGFYSDKVTDPNDTTSILNPDGTIRGNKDKYLCALDEGKAYVYGREIDTLGLDTKYLGAWKARTDGSDERPNHIIRKNNVPTTISVGNFVIAEIDAEAGNVPSMKGYSVVDIWSGADDENDEIKIGTLRIRGVEETNYRDSKSIAPSTVYKLFVFDVVMDVGKDFYTDAESLRIGAVNPNDTGTFRANLWNHNTDRAGSPFVYDANRGNFLFEGQRNSLVYPLAYGPVRTNYDVSYYTFESVPAVVNTDGAGTTVFTINTIVGLDRSFENEKYFIVNKSENKILTEGDDYTVGNFGTTSVSITAGTYQGDTLELYSRVRNTDASSTGTGSGRVRKKTLQTETRKFTTADPAWDASTGIYTLPFSDIQTTLVTLGVSSPGPEKWRRVDPVTGDVSFYEGSQIDNADTNVNDSGFNSQDIADDLFQVDTGHRDNFYGFGKLYLNEGKEFPADGIYVRVEYFEHSPGDYFSVDSYTDFDYGDIPVHETSTGQIFPLANAIDFRPTQDSGSASGFNSNNHYVAPNSLFTGDLEFYVGRIDKVVLSDDGRFEVITGKPAVDPLPPKTPDNAIVLHELTVPPYTFDAGDIKVKSQEYKRYTMSDISDIEKRLDSIEYYTSLNLLEKETSEMTFSDDQGLSKFKNGYIVDPFSSQAVGNVQHPEYSIAIDMEESLARPESATKAIDFIEDVGSLQNMRVTGDVLTLDYTEKREIVQPQHSNEISVNPFAIFSWNGSIKMSPSSDYWFSTKYRPEVQIDGGTVDSAKYREQSKSIGTVWNAWQTTWAGRPKTTQTVVGTTTKTQQREEKRWASGWKRLTGPWDPMNARVAAEQGFRRGRGRWALRARTQETKSWSDTTTTTTVRSTTSQDLKQQRTGVRTRAITRVEKKEVGDRQVGRYMIPWIREKVLRITGERLRPNTVLNVFFDGKQMNFFCRQKINGKFRTHRGFVTNDAGQLLECEFHVPNLSRKVFGRALTRRGKVRGKNNPAGNIRFRSGARHLVITNGKTPDDNNSDCRAEATYRAQGTMNVRQKSIMSTRVRDIVVEPVSAKRTTSRVLDQRTFTNQETVSTNALTSRTRITGWFDPLAESFLTPMEGGMFVTSIDIPFTKVDPSIPVSVQIRTMDNGYPAMEILPFGEKTLYPKQINLPKYAGHWPWTKFTFDAPVYVKQNVEYCFVVFSNSEKFHVRYAKMGKKDAFTGSPISKQPYTGVMFKSQNNSTWTADQEADMTFRINRAKFKTAGGTCNFIPNIPAGDLETESNPFFDVSIDNPFYTVNGSNYVKVEHESHGFAVNDTVDITIPEGSRTNTFNGITGSNLHGDNFLIQYADVDFYIIRAKNNDTATKTGACGGENIEMSQNVSCDTAQMNSTFVEPTGTNVDWKLSIKPFGTDNIAGPFDIPINDNIDFETTMSVEKDTMINDCILTAVLASDRDNISPFIDVERCSGYFVRNRINSPADTPYYPENTDASTGHIIKVDETETNSTSECKYITRPFSLANPADSITIYLDVALPLNTAIGVYYKTVPVGSDKTFVEQKWKPFSQTQVPDFSDNDEDFREYKWDIDDAIYQQLKPRDGAGNIIATDQTKFEEFQSFVVKVVLLSKTTTDVPKLKNFRAIALS